LFNIAQQEATTAKQEQQDDCRLRNKVESLLQSHNDTHVTTADEEHHTRAVLFLTQMFMDLQRETVETQTMLQSFSITYMKQVLSRIKTNGFSISNGESVAIGVGLFSQATNMNHSCRPNALQTFWYGTCGKFPLLQVTACTTIQASDEICISYIDNSCPRPLRQKRLVSYHFRCTCQACSDKDYNDALVGIKCNDCLGIVRQQTEESRDSCLCKCDACGNTDFTAAMDLIMETEKGMEHLTLQEQERLFTRAKAIFKRESWYVSECGEHLAQSLLDAIDSAADDRETQRFCARALAIYDELLLVNQSATPWNILKRQILLCKRAKLRLYLYPDPSMAIGELQSVLDTLLIYYPEEHEFVQEIRNTMSQAFS
jgi:SET and MYND domain-containing protein